MVKAFQEDMSDTGMDITVVIKQLAQRGITAQQVRYVGPTIEAQVPHHPGYLLDEAWFSFSR